MAVPASRGNFKLMSMTFRDGMLGQRCESARAQWLHPAAAHALPVSKSWKVRLEEEVAAVGSANRAARWGKQFQGV